jgi:hypothetical protein
VSARATIAAVFLLLSAVSLPADAALIYVASYGSDTTTCGADYTSPCKTMQRGVNRASAGDTVFIEYHGDHGAATITKALNIVAVIYGGVSGPTGVPCLTIAAGANDVISIEGLTCDQTGTTQSGIVFNSGKRLRLRGVDFRGGGGSSCGVRFQPNANALIDVADSSFGSWGRGLCVVPRSGADVRGSIENTELTGDAIGVLSSAGTGSLIGVTCDACHIVGGSTGVSSSGAGSVLRIRNSLVGGNVLGLSHPNSGKIVSLGSNALGGNTTMGTFTSTVLPQ